ncbi:MAG: AMP-binding protein [Burkholderiales bacterium]|nr:AMP-binding protein [Burkholderiales bacterium]
MNAAELLLAAGRPDAIALECGSRRLSYRALRQLVRRAAGAWLRRGLAPGERVFILAPDSIDWVVAYLGVIWAGGVAVGVNPGLAAPELAPILADSQVRFLWCDDELCAPMQDLLAGHGIAATLVAGGASWTVELLAAHKPEALPRDDEDPALWIGTSGTTGMPKGVVHAQRTVAHAHSFATGVLGLTAADRLYASSKLFFAYALGNSLFAGLRAGATVILDGEWPTPQRVQDIVRRHRPTLVFCVPTLYLKMLQSGVAHGLAGQGVRHFVSAGEVLPAATRRRWREATGLAPVSGYGTTETLCLMLYGDDDTGLLQPTPLTEIHQLPNGDGATPQRIWIRHATVALGYWRRPEAEADGFRQGWFSPGDQFLRHADGRLEYAGRNDDMLKIAGQWVSTLWVEQSLLGAAGEALQQLAAVGITTDDGLAALSVLAVAAPGREQDAARKVADAIDTLPRHRRPRWVHWLDALPLTATGKLQRARLQALHQEMSLRA